MLVSVANCSEMTIWTTRERHLQGAKADANDANSSDLCVETESRAHDKLDNWVFLTWYLLDALNAKFCTLLTDDLRSMSCSK